MNILTAIVTVLWGVLTGARIVLLIHSIKVKHELSYIIEHCLWIVLGLGWIVYGLSSILNV